MVNLVIADDHVVLRQALCEMLKTRGNYNVVAQARDGAELLEILKTQKPDIVIMDIAMPRLDGLEALEQLKGDNGNPPVLMLSADQGERKFKSVTGWQLERQRS